jgi:hypothetical protein
MKVFLTKEFAKRARKSGVSDLDLCEAVERAVNGSIDGDYGSELIKQRVARKNEGRSGGYRTILVYRESKRAVFLHMFAKSDQSDLTAAEKKVYRAAAASFAALADSAIEKLVVQMKWIEIDYENYRKEVSERSAPIAPSGHGGPPLRRRDR